MSVNQQEARLVKGLGTALITGVGAYYAYVVHANYSDGGGLGSTASLVALAILIAFGGIGVYLLFIQPTSSKFAAEVEIETRKVNWPEWDVVKRSTGQVTVVMIFLMLFLFLVDMGFAALRRVVL